MQEIYKDINFKCFDKLFLNGLGYQISNYGNVLKNGSKVNITNRNNKRLVFRINYNQNRYEFGVASCVAIAFLDSDFKTYDLLYRDNDFKNCKLSNIEILYRHAFRKKSDAVLDMFSKIEYGKMKKIFCSMMKNKIIKWKSYIDIDDMFQDYLMFCFERLDLYSFSKNKDIYQFCLSMFKSWYSKNMKKKVSSERFSYDLLDNYLDADASYNYLQQL